MDSFGIGGAWAFGYRLLASRALGHAAILIGIGIVAPLLLQYGVAGVAFGTVSPAMFGGNGLGAGLAAGAPFVVVMTLSYVLQTGSYFACWRLGFAPDRRLAGALLYGLVAGLIATAVIAVVAVVAIPVARQLWTPEAVILGVLVAVIPLGALFAIFYTALAAVVAAAVALLLVAAMVLGTAFGQVGFAATMVGGRGDIVVLLLVMTGVVMWLAARLSCTTSVMADRKTFNLIAAIRESWRLTWEEQWAIVRYLALIGFGLAILLVGAGFAVGASAAAMLGQGAGPMLQSGASALRLAAAIPIAFLTVLVPAGIYRELTRSAVPAEIFA